MASTISPLPNQQQQPEDAVPNTEAVSSNSYGSSGSLGPFFGVISVLAILAILSCFLGRNCARHGVTSLESDKHRRCSCGWFRRICFGRCMADHVEVLGENKAKVAAKEGDKETAKEVV